MIHKGSAGEVEGLDAIAFDQLGHALGADAGGRHLGVHVADHEIGGADIVAHDLPDHVVFDAAVVDLDRLELQALGIGVDRLDDAAGAGRQSADVEMVRVAAKPISRPWTNTGTMKATSGPWLAPE